MKHRLSLIIGIASFLLVCATCLPLLGQGIPHGWDTTAHLGRMEALHDALLDGQIPPRWSTKLAWGYGSPVLMFNWSFPYYLGELFRTTGMTLLDSLKSVVGLTCIGSFLTMYLFLSLITGPLPALLGSLWYIFAPYRFNAIYLRMAIGEATAFMLWPGIFYTTELFFQNHTKKALLLAPLFWAGLLLSHQALFLMILPLYGIFFLIRLIQTRAFRQSLFILLTGLLGVGMTAFFCIPAFLERNALGFSSIQTLYADNFLSIQTLFSHPLFLPFQQSFWQLFYGIGWSTLVAFFLIMEVLKSKKTTNTPHAFLFLIGGISAIFLTTPIALWCWEHIPLLSTFVYPQRFLGLAMFSSSICIALFLTHKKSQTQASWFSILLVVMMISSLPYLSLNPVRDMNIYALNTPEWTTTDMSGEFMPSTIPSDFIKTKDLQRPLVRLEKPGDIHTYTQRSHRITAHVSSDTPNTLQWRQFFFPGWNAYLNHRKISIEMMRDGTIEIPLPAQKNMEVEIFFEDTPIRTIANGLSCISVGIYSILFFFFLFAWLSNHYHIIHKRKI